MATTTERAGGAGTETPQPAAGRHTVVAADAGPTSVTAGRYLLAILRIAIAFEFLWAFGDKLFGWGYATPSERSWVNGGSPTEGFLANSATGPFESFYTSIAGATWADWLFMLGLLGIGVALLVGAGIRLAAVAGAVLLVMMWSVVLPPTNNPFLDTHLIEALALIVLAVFAAGDTLGIGRWWASTKVVRAQPWLR